VRERGFKVKNINQAIEDSGRGLIVRSEPKVMFYKLPLAVMLQLVLVEICIKQSVLAALPPTQCGLAVPNRQLALKSFVATPLFAA
jgi:hypothetical protein